MDGCHFVKSAKPTRFLYLINVGPAFGCSSQSIQERFCEFGPIEKVKCELPEGSRGETVQGDGTSMCSHLIFRDIESAIRAQKAVDGSVVGEDIRLFPSKKVTSANVFESTKSKRQKEHCSGSCFAASTRKVCVRFCTPRAIARPPSPIRPAIDLTRAQVDGVDSVPINTTLIEQKLPGLTFVPNFITTESEEATLMKSIDESPHGWDDTTLARRVQHYGITFDYTTLLVLRDAVPPIPSFLHPLMDRLVEKGIFPHWPNQVTINEYSPGVGISGHVDTHSPFDHAIVTVALGSQCAIEFIPMRYPFVSSNAIHDDDDAKAEMIKKEAMETRAETLFPGSKRLLFTAEPHGASKNQTEAEGIVPDSGELSVQFPRRALMAFDGIVRYAFKHRIASRKTDVFAVARTKEGRAKEEGGGAKEEGGGSGDASEDSLTLSRGRRISITFRCVRETFKCECPFPWACDFQTPKSMQIPTRLLQKQHKLQQVRDGCGVVSAVSE